MDLVDLNLLVPHRLRLVRRRDPYGSRGSKFRSLHVRIARLRRDPYGSRGSKFLHVLKKSCQERRDPYGSRGSKYVP